MHCKGSYKFVLSVLLVYEALLRSDGNVAEAGNTPTPVPEAERTYPIRSDESVPSWDDVIKGIVTDPSISASEAKMAIVQAVSKAFTEGGNKYYHLATAEITNSDLPEGPKDAAAYGAIFRVEHTPERVECYRRNGKVIGQHPKFKSLAQSCLFNAKTPRDAQGLKASIPREFCLGGEYQVDYTVPPSRWVRAKRTSGTGFKTVADYVDLLATQRGTKQYCDTMAELQKPENKVKVDQIFKTLEGKK